MTEQELKPVTEELVDVVADEDVEVVTETAEPAEPMIPKSRFDEVNEQRKALKQQIDDAEKARVELEKQKLKAEGDFKSLYEEALADADALRSTIANMQREQMIAQVATETGLPVALTSRLHGDDYDELLADAQAIMESVAVVTQPKAPNLTPGASSSNGAQTKIDALSEIDRSYLGL